MVSLPFLRTPIGPRHSGLKRKSALRVLPCPLQQQTPSPSYDPKSDTVLQTERAHISILNIHCSSRASSSTPIMTSSQSSQASTNYKEAFSLFDKRGTGRVALESLGDLLRACGQNPTLAEIRDLEKQAGGDCERRVYF